MGGQTALNLCIEADEKGIWEDFGVKLIGVNIDAINITEDREKFRELMGTIGVKMAPQATATSFLQGKEIAQETLARMFTGNIFEVISFAGIERTFVRPWNEIHIHFIGNG